MNALLAIVSTPISAPVVVATRLRRGPANSARGAARIVADALVTAKACGQGSGHGVYSVVALSRLACMFVAGGVVFVPAVRYN